MNTVGQKVLKSTLVHVVFAFLAMGGWGFYANSAYPMPEPIIAGFVQGIMSAFLTLFLKKSVDFMRPRFSGNRRVWLPPMISSVASATFLLCGHWVSGTPAILATIAVPLTVSVTYIFTYNVMRQRKDREG